MQSLPGFRDFYPEDCAHRNYILQTWRAVARRYGFVEYDGPVLESLELYKKKNESGAEILGQLYQFVDRGEREVALRPEMTPTLVRMVAAKERHYRKPLKWFCISNFFRYERPQKGRSREFIQFNADLIGDASPAADAEMIALVVDMLRAFGFTEEHFVVRVGDRKAWTAFLAARGCTQVSAVLQAADRLEKEPEEKLNAKLEGTGFTVADLKAFIAEGSPASFEALMTDMRARGMEKFIRPDLSIVRGLAYYNGPVFEVFDRSLNMRALAGGGRYDDLISGLSDGAADLPAIGFGMGDVVLGNLIDETPLAAAQKSSALQADSPCEIYVVVADEARRREVLEMAQLLRNAGLRTEYPLNEAKVGKQFQSAEQLGARYAVVVGAEWPDVKVKTLATREEKQLPHGELAEWLKNRENTN